MPGLTQEQVDELIEFIKGESAYTDEIIAFAAFTRVICKIKELQTPKKKYVEIEEFITEINKIRDLEITSFPIGATFGQVEYLARTLAKTLEELK